MKHKLVLIACLSGMSLYGQQLGLNSTYMFNEASYNPAAAGLKEFTVVHMNYRSQWAGFDGAPVSQFVSAHSAVGKGLGFGGNLYNESSGPSRTSGLSLMLSYRLRLSQNDLHGLRFGLGASFNQHLVDITKLTTEYANDPAIQKTYNNQFVPDADFGLMYTYGKKAFVGVSVKNVAQVKRSLFSYDDLINNTLNRHYYANAGYNFTLSEKVTLKSSVLMRYIEAKTMQLEGNLVADFNNKFWFGAGYRNKEAFNALLGVKVGSIQFGYCYDFGLSSIRNYASSSHEIFVQLQFAHRSPATGQTPWFKRNRLYK